MVRNGPRGLGWAWILAVLLPCGCQTADDGGTGDTGVSAIQFDDIPVPEGLTLRDRFHASDSRVVGEYRYANFIYTGLVELADARDYLRERMPQHSWTLIDHQVVEQGGEVLEFRRGRYRATCRLVNQADASLQMKMTVRTTLK